MGNGDAGYFLDGGTHFHAFRHVKNKCFLRLCVIRDDSTIYHSHEVVERLKIKDRDE